MSQVLSADEVKKHNSNRSLWMVIRNNVYDVTPFLEEHPGGTDPLMEAAGQDATIAFDDVGHSADAINMLKKYKIGTLAPGQGCSKLKWALIALGLAIIIGIAYKRYAS